MRTAICLLLVAVALAANPPKVVIDADQISVSGLSAGAFMAVQYHVAFSTQLVGAGVIAGGPFWCAKGSLTTAETACMAVPLMISVSTLVAATKSAASSGKVDPVSGLAGDKVYIYSGTMDTVVNPGVVKDTASYYGNFISSSNIQTMFTTPSEHAWITNNYGSSCSTLGSPYINNCQYDASGAILNQIYGKLAGGRGTQISSNIYAFNQTAYTPGGVSPASISLNDLGYTYIPTNCTVGNAPSGGCKLHIALHGCNQDIASIGNVFYTHVGLNEWAEANEIVIIYPQTIASESISMLNPEACFDWWGYTNSNYAYKNGPQMATINNIMNAFVDGSVNLM